MRRAGCTIVTVAVGLALWAHAAEAQGGTVSGRVLAQGSLVPVGGARIVLGEAHVRTTDQGGRFQFAGISSGPYRLRASAIGHEPLFTDIVVRSGETVEVEFELVPSATALPEVVIEGNEPRVAPGLREFERRRLAGGPGVFLTRALIESRNVRELSDLFRSVPGVRVECRGSGGQCQIRMRRERCLPFFYLNGNRADPTVIDFVAPGEIEGIEVYRGPSEIPPELNTRFAACGVVVIWLRGV